MCHMPSTSSASTKDSAHRVFRQTMTHVHGLSGELFNPGQDALDEQGLFAEVQQRRAAAAKAFIAADSDAKLRRAFTQKFQEQKENLGGGAAMLVLGTGATLVLAS